MDYIYCAVFSDNTAKFGRSVDVWNRLYGLDAEGRKFGRRITSCFISTVSDGVRCERQILDAAGELLTPVARESFAAHSCLEVSSVYDSIRLPYLFCGMSSDAFGPTIGKNSFSTDFALVEDGGVVSSNTTRSDRARSRVLDLFDKYTGSVTRSRLRNRLFNYSEDMLDEVLDGMVKDGEIIKIPYDKSQCGFRYELAV